MIEIKLFYEWLETNELTSSGIALWHGLMYIANRSGWRVEVNIPLATIILRTRLSKTTIYKERIELQRNGLIDFIVNDGRQSGTYRIISFESRIVSATRTQEGTQSGTQPGTEDDQASPDAFATRTQHGDIYKPKSNDYGEKYEGFNQVMNAAERYLRPVFVSTNLTSIDMLNRYGERTMDRLQHLCRIVEFKGDSLR